jgi:hypothetical protein
VAEVEATLGEAEVEVAGVVTSRRVVEVAAEAVDVAVTRQTVEVTAVAVAVVVSHPEAVGRCPFVVDRQEVVVAVSSREEVRRQWLPAFICMSPFCSRNNVPLNWKFTFPMPIY